MTAKKKIVVLLILIGLLAGVLVIGNFCAELIEDVKINGGLFSLESRLTAKEAVEPSPRKIEMEFPQCSTAQATAIAEKRLGRTRYRNALEYLRNSEAVRNTVGRVSDIRPAKGVNSYYPPFTDGDGGCCFTFRVAGDRGITKVSLRGGGILDHSASISEEILVVQLNDDQPQNEGPSTPLRLMDAKTEHEFDSGSKATDFSSRDEEEKAKQLEQQGSYGEAESCWKRRVAAAERTLDDKDLRGIQAKNSAEYRRSGSFMIPAIITSLESLLEFYERRHDSASQERTLKQLISINTAVYPKDSSFQADAHERYAKFLESERRFKAAADELSIELAIYEVAPPPNRRWPTRRRRKYEQLIELAKQNAKPTK